MNNVAIVGRLKEDVKLTSDEKRNTYYANLILDVEDGYSNKEKDRFVTVECECGGKKAKALHDYLRVGELISVKGRLVPKHNFPDILVVRIDDFQFLKIGNKID